MSLINLQGKLNCKYVVGFYFSHKPQRATLRERWPQSVEENLVRLEDAGLPYDRQIPKCSNCGGKQNNPGPGLGPRKGRSSESESKLTRDGKIKEMGHISRSCKEDRALIERVEVKCVNCSAVGHRARDCAEPRRDQFACRNCGYNAGPYSSATSIHSSSMECVYTDADDDAQVSRAQGVGVP